MSSKQTPFIIGAAVLLLLLLLYYFSGSGKSNYSWREHYDPSSKDPYGTYLVRNLLDGYFPDDSLQVVKDSLGARLDSGNFVYIGNDLWLDSVATNELLGFVAAGNRAFIASQYVPNGLLDSIGGFECVYEYNDNVSSTLSDTMVNLNFQHPNLADTTGYELKFLFLRQPAQHTWSYFPDEYLCDSQTVFATLGLMDDEQVNFVRASYGEGEFYFHTTPLAFTNLYLVEKRGLDYASKALSHLKPGPIYWDERSFDLSSNMADGGKGNRESPLKYILSQPPLAWTWYLMLGMALLYLIFRAKRRQRVIPVLEKNTNTSLEFIGTIGRLFFTQNNHRQLAAQKMRLFLIFVRERYHLPTKELNDQFAKGLAVRSNVAEEHIGKILNLHRNILNSGFLSEDTLVDFHRLMERFYRDCK